jgi:hypothetical protein
MAKAFSFYEKLVFVAYSFFILLGLSWLLASFAFGSYFNYWAFLTIAAFGTQAYFRQKLTNLILGVLSLGISIFWSLQFMWMGSKTGYDAFVKIMLGISLISIIMSVILIFSYTKLSFTDQ